MNETWTQDFTPESNWLSAGESCPKRPKIQTSEGKVLASIFWDAQGIVFINYLEKGRTTNSEYYIALSVGLKVEIATNEKESALSQRQCTMSQVDCNDGESTWTSLWIASTPTLFSRSGPQWLLAVCRPQMKALGKEIWLQ